MPIKKQRQCQYFVQFVFFYVFRGAFFFLLQIVRAIHIKCLKKALFVALFWFTVFYLLDCLRSILSHACIEVMCLFPRTFFAIDNDKKTSPTIQLYRWRWLNGRIFSSDKINEWQINNKRTSVWMYVFIIHSFFCFFTPVWHWGRFFSVGLWDTEICVFHLLHCCWFGWISFVFIYSAAHLNRCGAMCSARCLTVVQRNRIAVRCVQFGLYSLEAKRKQKETRRKLIRKQHHTPLQYSHTQHPFEQRNILPIKHTFNSPHEHFPKWIRLA